MRTEEIDETTEKKENVGAYDFFFEHISTDTDDNFAQKSRRLNIYVQDKYFLQL